MENELHHHPAKAALHGFIASLQQENNLMQVKCIDTDENTVDHSMQVLVNEIEGNDISMFTGYRQGQRFVPVLQKIENTEDGHSTFTIEEGKTYLLIGGLSDEGLQLAKRIASKKTRLVICDSISLPLKGCWDDILDDPKHPCYTIIYTLIKLKQASTDIDYHCIDTSDPVKLEASFASICETAGVIGGIFHLAAMKPATNLTGREDETVFARELGSFITGTGNLMQVIEKMNAPVCVFTTYCGITGYAKNKIFASASTFLDEMILGNAAKGSYMRLVRWPAWSAKGLPAGEGEYANGKPILTDDALNSLDRIFEKGFRQVIVSELDPVSLGPNPYFQTIASDNVSGQQMPVIEEMSKPGDSLPAPKQVDNEEEANTSSRLLRIWKEVLKIDTIGMSDDFFDLGGHSLNGGQIINKILKEFHVTIEFEDILDYSTVETLASFIDTLAVKTVVKQETDEPVALGTQEHYEVSPAQKRLWIVQQLDKTVSAYNMSAGYEFNGAFDVPSFLQAFDLLVKRHESLRTTFITVDGEPRQKIHHPASCQCKLEFDNSLVLDPVREASLKTMISEDAMQAFDLENGPLVRGKLVQMGQEKYAFFFTVHHIIADGWSLKILLNELIVLYDTLVKGKENTLMPLKLQCRDLVAWQNKQLNATTFNEAKTYWHKQFAGEVPVLELPGSLERPLVRGYNAKRVSLFFDNAVAGGLKELGKRNDATSFMTMLAAVKTLLFIYSGQKDIVIGTPVSGRNHSAMENQVGLYLNTVAIRTQFEEQDSFECLLQKIRENTLNAFKYQSYPFDRLLDDLDIVPAKGRSPLFDIGFTFNNFSNTNIGMQDNTVNSFQTTSIKPIDHGHATVKADLWFHIFDAGDNIRINLDYNTGLFNAAFIKKFLSDYEFVTRQLQQSPGISLKEMTRLVEAHNDNSRERRKNDLRTRNADRLKERFLK